MTYQMTNQNGLQEAINAPSGRIKPLACRPAIAMRPRIAGFAEVHRQQRLPKKERSFAYNNKNNIDIYVQLG